MNKVLLAALLIFTLPAFIRAANEPNADQFAILCGTAKDMDDTPEGKEYEQKFANAISTPLSKALQSCAQGAKLPVLVNIIFIIGGNGKIEHVFAEPGNSVSACVAAKLTGEKVAKPPKSEWMLLVNINVHQPGAQ